MDMTTAKHQGRLETVVKWLEVHSDRRVSIGTQGELRVPWDLEICEAEFMIVEHEWGLLFMLGLPEFTDADHEYIVSKGDTLAKIVAACNAMGVPITMAELLKANPGLDPARLKVGQQIRIPSVVPGDADLDSPNEL